jgi:hypothetical protein
MPYAWLWLLGCPHPEAPLAARLAQLDVLDRAPLEPEWPAQATVVVSDSLVDRLVAEVAQSRPIPEIAIRPPLGFEIRARPRLGAPRVGLAASPRGPWCIDVAMGWQGHLGLSLAGWSADVAWRSDVGATVAILGIPTPDGLLVSLEPVAREAWTVDVALEGVPAPYDRIVSHAVERQLEIGVREAGPLSAAIPLALVPLHGPVRLRGLRAWAGEDLAIDLAFSTMSAGAVASVPDPGEGFAVVLPAATLLGLAQAALIRQGPTRAYQPEPTVLHLDGGRFELWLRVWKQGRRPRWREYVLRGTIGFLPAGGLAFHAEDVDEVARENWSTAIDPLIRGLVLRALESAADVQVPARYVQPLGDKAVSFELVRIAAQDDVLTIWGVVD